MSKIRVSGLVGESIVDGPGFRYAIFAQGCTHNCEGCHNPQTHDINGGYEVEIDQILEEIDGNPLLDGITLTGGEPLLQAKQLLPLVKKVKERGLSIVIYSGYIYEEIMKNKEYRNLVKQCDILIDGKFELDLRSLDLLYRGSSNQRIIDIPKSMKAEKIILWDQ